MNRRQLFTIFLFGIGILLSSCGYDLQYVDVSKDQPQPGKGLLYVYRSKAFAGKAVASTVYVNGEETTYVPNNSHVVLNLDPGIYNIEPSRPTLTDRSSAMVRISAGETYFVEIFPTMDLMPSFGPLFVTPGPLGFGVYSRYYSQAYPELVKTRRVMNTEW